MAKTQKAEADAMEEKKKVVLRRKCEKEKKNERDRHEGIEFRELIKRNVAMYEQYSIT